jgi:hypothetical protein
MRNKVRPIINMSFATNLQSNTRFLFTGILIFSASIIFSQNYQSADLPDALTFLDGSKVKTKSDWQRRKKKIKNLWCEYFIGYYPKNAPKLISANVIETSKQKDGITKKRIFLFATLLIRSPLK